MWSILFLGCSKVSTQGCNMKKSTRHAQLDGSKMILILAQNPARQCVPNIACVQRHHDKERKKRSLEAQSTQKMTNWCAFREDTYHGLKLLWKPLTKGVLKEGKKKSVAEREFCKKTACSSYVQPWLVALGGWRLVAIGG